MSQWLVVGDPHVLPDEIEDCRRLADCIVDTVEKYQPKYLVFLGDQHHNHSLVHVDVLAYWHETFARLLALPKPPKIFALVGNHDMSSDKGSVNHAMRAYERQIHVVSAPHEEAGVLLLPYYHDREEFSRAVSQSSCKTVVCHQTLDGSRYENGFYSQDGVDLSPFQDRHFLSGHIHTPQAFGNVVYVGAPRWRTVSDANIERSITLWTLGAVAPKQMASIDTGLYCEKIIQLIDHQDAPLEHVMKPGWRYIVDVHGDEAFVAARKNVWAGARVRTFVFKSQQPAVSESMGIGKAMKTFVAGFRPPWGTPVAELDRLVSERVKL